jgi:sulfur carrier protein ThiS
MGFSALLAFYQINNKPFIFVVEAAFKYFFSSKLYIWKKDQTIKPRQSKEDKEVEELASVMVPKISDSKLKDLTWSLDIKESMYTNKNQQ